MSLMQGSILVIDDDSDVLVSAKMFLEEFFSQVHTEQKPEKITRLITSQEFDVILLDMNFRKGESDGQEGLFWLRHILEMKPDAIIILMTAFGDVELAVEAIKMGATDFILKPWQNSKLHSTILGALQKRCEQTHQQKQQPNTASNGTPAPPPPIEIIGKSEAIQKVKSMLEKVAQTNANVLILGENGTGKEVVARAIHRQSERAQKPFVSVDLAALNPNLFESEIFGHKAGAFTDAKKDKTGHFERASTGTLFLDEIGNLNYPLQAKLLSALQTRKIQRIGDKHEIPIDVRLISATNKPLSQMVEKEQFRQDLLYRINTVEIILPPLRERTQDIPLLAEHFLNTFKKKYNKPTLKISHRAMKKLEKHPWKGNIRELQNLLERAAILSEKDEIDPAQWFGSDYMQPLQQTHSLKLEEMEKQLIIKAIRKNSGNITRAAKDLGIQRNALYRRMQKYGLQ